MNKIDLSLNKEDFYKKYGRKKTVSLFTLGCKVNQYETEAITEQFLRAGYAIGQFAEKNDIYIVNTCTVTNIADKKSRKILSRAKKNNPESIVVAVGCYVQMRHEELKEMPYIDLLVGNTHKDQLVKYIEVYQQHNSVNIDIEDMNHVREYEELNIQKQQNKTRSTLKIQDGCDQYCTYCIIPYTRGHVRSRQPEAIIEEVHLLVSYGYQEIVLTGIHIGSYGKDLDNVTLIGLIQQLNAINGLKRIRIGSIEPGLVTEEFVHALVQCEKVCPHFHLSLQSGSNSVLKRMHRKYTVQQYKEKVQLLCRYYDAPALTTDIIVGFPMETEEETKETLEFAQSIGFSDVHVFKYSKRDGTKAAEMKGQIDEQVKQRRSQQLIELMKEQLQLMAEIDCLEKQIHLLEEELLDVRARIKLFENRRIPNAKTAIRKIGQKLQDDERLTIATAKVVKTSQKEGVMV